MGLDRVPLTGEPGRRPSSRNAGTQPSCFRRFSVLNVQPYINVPKSNGVKVHWLFLQRHLICWSFASCLPQSSPVHGFPHPTLSTNLRRRSCLARCLFSFHTPICMTNSSNLLCAFGLSSYQGRGHEFISIGARFHGILSLNLRVASTLMWTDIQFYYWCDCSQPFYALQYTPSLSQPPPMYMTVRYQ